MSTTGSGSGGSGGGAIECTPADLSACPSVFGLDCRSVSCVEGKCVVVDLPLGTPLASQTAGDCKRAVCNGFGNWMDVADAMDLPDDANECTTNACSADHEIFAPVPDATPCAAGFCKAGHCEPPSCVDGIVDGAETDLDCGGSQCAACPAGKGCGAPSDCQSGVCAAGVCAIPTCADGVKNGGETDIDCGGPQCADCPAGKGCGAPGDCQSGVCQAGSCAVSTCADGVKNGGETDIDCGGADCPDCPAGKACAAPGDCQSDVCNAGVCMAPTCSDGVKNGGEADVDCGGADCPLCPVGAACSEGSDCVDSSCDGGLCAAPTCADGVQNGGETGVDCSGPCGPCGLGAGCVGDADCASGACFSGHCAFPGFDLYAPRSFRQPTFNGTAIAAADFDGDGLLDVATADIHGDSLTLLLGEGGGELGPIYTVTVCTSPRDVAAADFDGDGKADIAVACDNGLNASTGAMTLILDPLGGAAQMTTIAMPKPAEALATGDVDGDGDIDLAVGMKQGTRLLFNAGNGAMLPGGDLTTSAEKLLLLDVDDDADLDLVAKPDHSASIDTVIVWLNQGGAFPAPSTISVFAYVDLAMGDLTGDGKPDIALAEGGGMFEIVRNLGGGSFGQRTLRPTIASDNTRIAIRDVDGDGKQDVLLVAGEVSYQGVDRSLVVAKNQGGLIFQEIAYRMGDAPQAILTGDFDGDCWPDVAASTGDAWHVNVLRNQGEGVFRSLTQFEAYEKMFVADLDGDGSLDVVTGEIYADWSPAHIRLNWNDAGDFSTTNQFTVAVNDIGAVAAEDLDGDGLRELVVSHDLYGRLSIYKNLGNRAFAAPVSIDTCGNPQTIASGDIDGDGKLDLVIGCPGQNAGYSFQVHINKGGLTFTLGAHDVYLYFNDLTTGDLNGDGKVDLVLTYGGGVMLRLNKGNGTFFPGTYLQTGSGAASPIIFDADGDGAKDVAFVHFGDGSLAILKLAANGDLVSITSHAVGVMPTELRTDDLDGDGRPDLVVADWKMRTIGVLRNRGQLFAPPLYYALQYIPQGLGLGDLNGDGKVDAAASSGTRTMLLWNVSGSSVLACGP